MNIPIEFDNQNWPHDLHIRRTYFKRTDMTVTTTADVYVDKMIYADGRIFWINVSTGSNAAGEVVYLDLTSSATAPSWVP
jgi:predicted RNA-binding protein associated with RNAse of E/G family